MANLKCLEGHKIKIFIAFVFVSRSSWKIDSTQKNLTTEKFIKGLFTEEWSRGRE